MKLIIAGSRTLDWITPGHISEYVQALDIPEITTIVSGTARGIDKVGELFAELVGLECARFPANWDLYGKKAGHLRNFEMAQYADALLIVWDGESRGSKNMKDTMIAMNKDVYEVVLTIPQNH
jgi:hypothetical protein